MAAKKAVKKLTQMDVLQQMLVQLGKLTEGLNCGRDDLNARMQILEDKVNRLRADNDRLLVALDKHETELARLDCIREDEKEAFYKDVYALHVKRPSGIENADAAFIQAYGRLPTEEEMAKALQLFGSGSRQA